MMKKFSAFFNVLSKTLTAVLKLLVLMAILAVGVGGSLAAFLAVLPQHAPSWMFPAQKMLETFALWEAPHKSDIMKVGQVLIPVVVPTVSILLLVLYTLSAAT